MTDLANEQVKASVSMQALLTRKHEVILVIDLVDSVRLMQTDEAGTIERWLGFQERALAQTIPAYAGRVARSTGDGLLVVFASSLQAVQAALGLHRLLHENNRLHPVPSPWPCAQASMLRRCTREPTISMATASIWPPG